MDGNERENQRDATIEQLRSELAELRGQVATGRRLQQLADAVPAYISHMDRQMRYTLVNRFYSDQFKMRPDELVGRRLDEVLGEAAFDKIAPHLAAALAGEKVRIQQQVEIPRLGLRDLDVSFTPDVAEDGGVEGCLVLAHDVTEKRRAKAVLEGEVALREAFERLLRDSEQRFRTLANSLPQLVWVAEQDGTVSYYNSSASGYQKLEHQMGSGWQWQPVVHPDDLIRTREAWERAVRTREAYECEHRVCTDDGTYRWHLSRAHYDEPSGRWFGTATDIHEVKEAQQALQQSDRRKDEFLAMLGHELRNPLATIRSAIDLLMLMQGEDPRVREAHAALARQSTHMARLVDGLLEVSRVTLGKISLEQIVLDLRELVARVVEDHRGKLTEHELSISLDMPEQPIWVEADEVRLAQVFGNLLSNAIKFTAPGGDIALSVSRIDGQAVVRMRDSGIGIEPSQLPLVFEPFQQETTDIARVGGGLGLGLALVRGLVELHGGRVEGFSEGRGKGSEFRVVLPMTQASVAPSERRDSEPAAQRILIVEDNNDAAHMLQMLLEVQGHDVAVAPDGPHALESLRNREADIVLCDIGLPGMSGYEVAKSVRTDPSIHVPKLLVAMTGYGQQEDQHRAREAGFDRHLVKPLDLAALRTVLSQAQ